MAGVGKLLKQAQKMQRQMESVQEELARKEIEVSSGGGAVKIVITGQQVFQKIEVDPELLQEDAGLVQDTLLVAVNEALAKSKEVSEEAMGKVSEGFAMPGLM
jgi:DNA-binding YbaB/EbfC family protein